MLQLHHWLPPTNRKLKSMILPEKLLLDIRMLSLHTPMFRLLFKKPTHSAKTSVPFRPNAKKLLSHKILSILHQMPQTLHTLRHLAFSTGL
jgi:hypothetical protein